MNVTQADKSQPLPNHACELCRNEIKVGDPYKHVTPKSGPYGGRTRYRCATCPDWQSWDLSNSLSARIEEIVHDEIEGIDIPDLPDPDDEDDEDDEDEERMEEWRAEVEDALMILGEVPV